jgi:hypothetical protein
MGDLESQLLRFPSGTNDDLLDSLTLAVRLLTDAPSMRSFSPKTQDDKFKELRAMFEKDKEFKGHTGSKNKSVIPATKSFMVK